MSRRYLAALVLLAFPFTAESQMISNSRVYGTDDKDIVTPVHSTALSSDVTAVQVLVDFLKATQLTGWVGMTASGTLVFAGDPTSYSATLAVLGGTKYRLDVERPAGLESTIFDGSRGTFINASGVHSSISSDIASTGLLAFPRFLSSGYPSSSSVVTDRGNVTLHGATTHRITLDDPSTDGTGNAWKTLDLYFDPSSGRLLESASPVHLSTADAAIYVLETAYSNYSILAGMSGSFPTTIGQSLNGQLQWTLSITQASISTLPPPSRFEF